MKSIPPGADLDIYISPACPYCREAMAYYDTAHTPYRVHDAQNDRTARARMFEFSGGDPTVPVIVVNGEYVQSGWGSPPRG